MSYGDTFAESFVATIEHYRVAPANVVQVVIEQVETGGNRGGCYIGIEDLLPTEEVSEGQIIRRWQHRKRSARSAPDIHEARCIAEELWKELRSKDREGKREEAL